MQNFGVEDYRSTIINTVFSVALIILIIGLKRTSYYGLTKIIFGIGHIVNLLNGADLIQTFYINKIIKE